MRFPTSAVVLACLASLSARAQTPVNVNPTSETQVVLRGGASDLDVALWPNTTAPNRSLLVVGDVNVGLTTYALDGGEQEVRQTDGVALGVDVQEDFALPGTLAPLIVATNGTLQALTAYVMDSTDGGLGLRRVDTGALRVANFNPVAVTLYRSATSGRFYAFMANASGTVQQLELSATTDGGVESVAVRDFVVGGAVSGMVADDQQGVLFVAQRDNAIWRYSAEPNGGVTPELVASVTGGSVAAPLGGLALYALADGDGYLLAASGGGDRVVLFPRRPPHTAVGSFKVQASGTIDEVSGSDSLEASSRPLGAAFPGGLVALHDAQNSPTQNHKLISWQAIANAFSPPLRSSAQSGSSDGGTDGGADAGSGKDGGGVGTTPGGGTFPGDDSGCGCATASVPGSLLLLVLGLGVRGRRRRG